MKTTVSTVQKMKDNGERMNDKDEGRKKVLCVTW